MGRSIMQKAFPGSSNGAAVAFTQLAALNMFVLQSLRYVSPHLNDVPENSAGMVIFDVGITAIVAFMIQLIDAPFNYAKAKQKRVLDTTFSPVQTFIFSAASLFSMIFYFMRLPTSREINDPILWSRSLNWSLAGGVLLNISSWFQQIKESYCRRERLSARSLGYGSFPGEELEEDVERGSDSRPAHFRYSSSSDEG